MKIYALHGFLGKPSDWNFLPFEKVSALDLYSNPITPFWEWAGTVNRSIAEDREQERVLIGYSMGGRLALHLLLEDPTLWSRVVVISCHAGLESDAEKELRIKHDGIWAERFDSHPWDPLMKEWNEQAVFRGQKEKSRVEADYTRERLKESLVTWSLGRQENLIPHLKQVKVPIDWIAGQNDEKYVQLAKMYAQHVQAVTYHEIQHSGHRVLFDNPSCLINFFSCKSFF